MLPSTAIPVSPIKPLILYKSYKPCKSKILCTHTAPGLQGGKEHGRSSQLCRGVVGFLDQAWCELDILTVATEIHESYRSSSPGHEGSVKPPGQLAPQYVIGAFGGRKTSVLQYGSASRVNRNKTTSIS